MKKKQLKIVNKTRFCTSIFVLILICILIYIFFSKVTRTATVEISSLPENTIIVEKQLKEDITISMSVIGDIMCHNSQYVDAYVSSTDNYDFSYVFKDIKNYINSADIAVGNLETTFAGKAKGYSNYPRFNTPEQLANNLKDFGIDVLSTANNHCMDTNYSGLVSTLNYLDEAGISHMGTYDSKEAQDTVLIKDVNGIKIAFLSFTYGTNGITIPTDKSYSVNLIDEALILEQLSLAKAQSPGLICVSMHWGIEYQTTQNSTQEDLADFLFNNGVDVILGSHPHVLQPMEKKTITLEDGSTKDCFVIYSLGNFMSGQTAENTKNSIILNIKFTKSGENDKTTIDSISYVPIYMYKASGNAKQRYRVLDIEQSIADYDSGNDTSIGESTYSTIKKELTKIRKTMGEI
jgi:poly-gamma-glutamate synthesis protein (capsule biosynthesis protein)